MSDFLNRKKEEEDATGSHDPSLDNSPGPDEGDESPVSVAGEADDPRVSAESGETEPEAESGGSGPAVADASDGEKESEKGETFSDRVVSFFEKTGGEQKFLLRDLYSKLDALEREKQRLETAVQRQTREIRRLKQQTRIGHQ